MFSIDGLVSGLDTASIIEGLVSLQQSQVDRLNVRKNDIITQQTAFQGIEARVLSLRATMSRLNRTTSSVFEESFATTSDESLVTVKAGNNAAEGSYIVRVTSLARAHQIGSQGFDSNSTSTSQGTISFQVGARPATTITIDDSNNTITGLVDAINAQSPDVSASIIHDQANNADRILLTSKHTGASNGITVNNNLAVATGNEVRPDFTGPAIQEASNAAIQLGSGPGAITAEYESNTVDGLIENITLDLISIDANQDVTINVSRDTESARAAIEDFVDEYNSLISYIDEQTRYNSETNVASPLNGNRNVSGLKNKLSSMVTETVPGLDTGLNRFSQIGVEIDATGRLTIDSVKLDNALDGGAEAFKPQDVKRLFGLDGTSTNSGIDFILGSSRTVASATPYEVDIVQPAERASVVATNSLAASTVIDGTNQEFQISVDGEESEVLTLTAGTYTPQELADHLQTLINASTTLANRNVIVSLESDALEITSNSYGRSSEIANISGSAISDFGFDGSETDLGQDVVGSFIVNGIVETATGTGRVLAGDSDNENTADLQVRVTLDATHIGAGSEGEISVTRGISSRLDQYFGDLLDPANGTIKVANDAFELRVESLEASIERVNAISEAKSQYLIEQFAQLERVLSELQATSGFLSSQLLG
jgi:flagellar hook-associated protein 2